ncbi:MAG: TlpA disulfide reductase family protein, partial [Bacteroidota bacterium]
MKTWLGKLFSTALPIILALILFPYLRDWYMTPSVTDGDRSKDFTATIIGGKELKLSDLRGQHVLLHFWGSWCSPCRSQNQQLVPLMRSLEGEITPISIAIERDSNRWLAAIRKDDLY